MIGAILAAGHRRRVLGAVVAVATVGPALAGPPAAGAASGRIVYPGACGTPQQVGICVIDDNLAGERTLVLSGGAVPTWSPDGRWLAYDAPGGIGVAGADGASPTTLTAPVRPRIDTAPVWSADGAGIFWQRETGAAHSAIWKMDADGGRQRRAIDNHGRADRQPLELLDGRLTFLRDGTLVATRHARGAGLRRLMTGADLPKLRVSPDGSMYAFLLDPGSGAADHGALWTIGAEGRDLRRRVADTGAVDLRWTRDGRRLLALSFFTGVPYVVDLAGGGQPQRPALLAGLVSVDWWTPGPPSQREPPTDHAAPAALVLGDTHGPVLARAGGRSPSITARAAHLHLEALDPSGVRRVAAAFVRAGDPRPPRFHDVTASSAFERRVGTLHRGRYRLLVRTQDVTRHATAARRPLEVIVKLTP